MTRFLFPVLLAVALISCRKDSLNKYSYISYEINGPSCNGEFGIERADLREVSVALTPAVQDDPEIVFIEFLDIKDMQQVIFIIPAAPGHYLINYDSDFQMLITHTNEECALSATFGDPITPIDGVTVTVAEFVRGEMGLFGLPTLAFLEVYFSGKMIKTNEMFEIEVHEVTGSFVYSSDDVN